MLAGASGPQITDFCAGVIKKIKRIRGIRSTKSTLKTKSNALQQQDEQHNDQDQSAYGDVNATAKRVIQLLPDR